MRAVVVYESFKGNTRKVAEAIGEALERVYDVTVVPVGRKATEAAEDADLVVVGGPTWAHGMTSRKLREQNPEPVGEPTSTGLEWGAREWIEALPSAHKPAAAFDTRVNGPRVLTGAASKKIAQLLVQRGARLVASPESFLVNRHENLLDGELDRARTWASGLIEQRRPVE